MGDVTGRHHESVLGARQCEGDPSNDERLTDEPQRSTAQENAVSWATTARGRLGDVRNVGTTVLCPYSRATAMAPNSPVPIMALKANAISDCWSAAVAMNPLLPSMSVPNMTTAASMPAMMTNTARNPTAALWW